MNDLDQTLAAGTLLIIETGEYSDSSWHGPVRMLKDARKADLAQEFAGIWRPNPARSWVKGPDTYDFLPWLIRAGYAEDVANVTSWHVGSYGEFRPE